MKGISPIVAFVLLIAIAVISGVSVYFWASNVNMNTTASTLTNPDTPIAVNPIGSNYILVSNLGNNPISASVLRTSDPSVTVSCNKNVIEPGTHVVCELVGNPSNPNKTIAVYGQKTGIAVVKLEEVGGTAVSSPNWYYVPLPYRQKIFLHGSDQTNYQVELDLNASNVGPHFNWSNSGLRFTYLDNGREVTIPYWIESWNSTTQQAKIWIKVPLITQNTTVYMYYGGTLTNESNGDAVFLFFDGFNETTLDRDKWVNYTNGGTISVSNGMLYLAHLTADSEATYIESKTQFNTSVGFLSRWEDISTTTWHDTFISLSSGQEYTYGTRVENYGDGIVDKPYKITQCNSTGCVDNYTSIPHTTFHTWLINYRFPVSTFSSEGQTYILDSNPTTPPFYITIGTRKVLAVDKLSKMYVDWIAVKKYLPPEPVVSFGSEETPVYRQAIYLLGDNLTDYQVELDLNASNVGPHFDWDHVRLEFTYLSGNVEITIPYWIESWNSTTQQAKIWIKVPLITQNTTVYMYYGGTLTNESNGDAVFLFFDDFSGTSLDPNKWDTSTYIGTNPDDYNITNGTLWMWNNWGGCCGGGCVYDHINTKAFFTPPIAVETRFMVHNASGNPLPYCCYICYHAILGNRDVAGISSDGAGYAFRINDTGTDGSYSFPDVDKWHRITEIFLPTEIEIETDYGLNESYSNGEQVTSGPIGLAGDTDSSTIYDIVDWIAIRKYSSLKPTYSLGKETIVL